MVLSYYYHVEFKLNVVEFIVDLSWYFAYCSTKMQQSEVEKLFFFTFSVGRFSPEAIFVQKHAKSLSHHSPTGDDEKHQPRSNLKEATGTAMAPTVFFMPRPEG